MKPKLFVTLNIFLLVTEKLKIRIMHKQTLIVIYHCELSMPLNYHCIGNLNLLLLKNEAHETKFEKWDPPMVNRALVSISSETFENFVTIFSGAHL